MHVALSDADGARSLADRLERIVDAGAVRLDAGRTELAVALEPESDRSLARVVDVVCTWVEDGERGARVQLGSREYVLPGRTHSRRAG